MVLLVVWYAHYYIQQQLSRLSHSATSLLNEYSIRWIGCVSVTNKENNHISYVLLVDHQLSRARPAKKISTTHMQKSLYSPRNKLKSLRFFSICLFILIQFLSSGTHIVAPKMENKLFRSSARSDKKKHLVKSNVIPLKNRYMSCQSLCFKSIVVAVCWQFFFPLSLTSMCFSFCFLHWLHTRNYSYRNKPI